MESPEPGSPTEYEDEVEYPCKGCGQVCIRIRTVMH